MLKCVFLLATAAVASGLAQDPPDVILRQTFQQDAEGWAPLGPNAKVRAAEGGRAGGTLFLSYELAPKQPSATVLRAPAGFAGMRRIRFRARTDHDTAMALLLSEQKPGGGNYMAWFWSPANTWQTIEFAPSDFTLSDAPNDPKDIDGKLDLDQVEGLGLLDLAQFFAEMPANGVLPLTVERPSGPRTVEIENFEVLRSPADARKAAGAVPLSTLSRNFLDWVTPGGMKLQLNSSGNPLAVPAIQATYEQREGQFALLLRRVGQTEAAGTKRLVFDVASEHEATLVISLETRKPGGGQGPRYTLPIYPPGGKEVFHVDLKFSDFQGDGPFDPALWRTIAIMDITAASGGGDGANTVWVGNIEAVK